MFSIFHVTFTCMNNIEVLKRDCPIYKLRGKLFLELIISLPLGIFHKINDYEENVSPLSLLPYPFYKINFFMYSIEH